jgi:uncharacterized protein (TIGR03437 family)
VNEKREATAFQYVTELSRTASRCGIGFVTRVLPYVLSFASCLSAQTVTVKIPGQASQILFAGSDPRYTATEYFGSQQDTFPENRPQRVELALQAGQAIQITAAGEVNLDVRSASRLNVAGPGGVTEAYRIRNSYIQSIRARWGSLIGIFLPDQLTYQDSFVSNFLSAAEQVDVLEPLLQAPFLIGDGRTSAGVTRTFIVPRGATRLYLGILDGPVSNNSGEFTATVRVVPRPAATTGLVNPVRLLGTGSVRLGGYAPGTFIRGRDLSAVSPINDPVTINLATLGTNVRRLRIGAVGSIDVDLMRGRVSPDGIFTTIQSFSASSATGKSGLRAPLGSLVGIFLRDQFSPEEQRSFESEFGTTATRDATPLSPLIQQYFYIGTGRTTAGVTKEYEVPTGATRLILGIHDEGNEGVADNYGFFFVAVSPVVDGLPEYPVNQITNGASFQSGAISAGSIVTIKGERLSSGTVQANAVPLPAAIGGTRVWFNEFPGPLFFVSPGQINAQVPFELGTASTVQVVVSNGGPPGTPQVVPMAPLRPGIFLYGDNKPVIVNVTTGQLVAESGPVRRGDALVIYGTGLGAASTQPPAGVPASLTELSTVLADVKVVIGGSLVDALFAGLAPGFVGVNQVNVVVPSNAPLGPTTLHLVTGGVESNKVGIEIGN